MGQCGAKDAVKDRECCGAERTVIGIVKLLVLLDQLFSRRCIVCRQKGQGISRAAIVRYVRILTGASTIHAGHFAGHGDAMQAEHEYLTQLVRAIDARIQPASYVSDL